MDSLWNFTWMHILMNKANNLPVFDSIQRRFWTWDETRRTEELGKETVCFRFFLPNKENAKRRKKCHETSLNLPMEHENPKETTKKSSKTIKNFGLWLIQTWILANGWIHVLLPQIHKNNSDWSPLSIFPPNKNQLNIEISLVFMKFEQKVVANWPKWLANVRWISCIWISALFACFFFAVLIVMLLNRGTVVVVVV